jgi:S1-C subfamily serine protease
VLFRLLAVAIILFSVKGQLMKVLVGLRSLSASAPSVVSIPEKPKVTDPRKVSVQVRVQTITEDRARYSFGSGTFIKPNIVLTNAHVTQPSGDGTVSINLDSDPTVPPLVGKIIKQVKSPDQEEGTDLALVQVEGNHPYIDLCSELPPVGLVMKILGHPRGSRDVVETAAVAAIVKPTFLELNLKLKRFYPVQPGNSGGPLLQGDSDSGYCQAGVVSQVDTRPGYPRPNIQRVRAQSIKQIKKFLDTFYSRPFSWHDKKAAEKVLRPIEGLPSELVSVACLFAWNQRDRV